MNKTLLTLSALALTAAALTGPARADDAMGGMKMAPKPAATPLTVTATVNPAAPQAGDNTLALTILDAGGKPATGLKLTSSVAMTSMDMGTTHPAVTEKGGGQYAATVNLSMVGLWRVVVRSGAAKVAVLDFEAGAKAPWKSPPVKAAARTPAPAATPATASPPAEAAKPVDKPAGSSRAPSMTGMDMKGMTGIADLKTATVPELQETGTYTATGDENWEKQTGFGHNAGMVAMMNQMMVGGSGMEGMKMPAMTMKFDEQNYAKPDAEDADTSMPGMKMDAAPESGAAPAAPAPVKITATTASAPKSGDNPLLISVTDARGKAVTGAAVTASVAMTSMDMGTTHPAVTEKGGGQYAATVNFSMVGPWRVKVKVTAPGQKPQTRAFDFSAK